MWVGTVFRNKWQSFPSTWKIPYLTPNSQLDKESYQFLEKSIVVDLKFKRNVYAIERSGKRNLWSEPILTQIVTSSGSLRDYRLVFGERRYNCLKLRCLEDWLLFDNGHVGMTSKLPWLRTYWSSYRLRFSPSQYLVVENPVCCQGSRMHTLPRDSLHRSPKHSQETSRAVIDLLAEMLKIRHIILSWFDCGIFGDPNHSSNFSILKCSSNFQAYANW